jgi:hypothetical protein
VARGQRRLRPRRAGGRELVEPRAPLVVFGVPFFAAPFALPVAFAVPLADVAAPVDAPPAGRGLRVTGFAPGVLAGGVPSVSAAG